MKSIVACFIILIAGAVCAKTILKYNLKKGEMLRYKSVSNTDMTTNQGGQDIPVTIIGTGIVRAEVIDATAQSFTYLTSIEEFKVAVNSIMTGDTTLNVKEVVGKQTRRVSTVQGRELSAVVIDTIRFKDQMMQRFAQSSKTMGKILWELPSSPVGIGDSWEIAKKDTQEAEGGAIVSNIIIKATYLRDVDTLGHKSLAIGYTMTIGMEGKMKIQKQFDAAITGEGSGKGTTYFDAGAGKLVANLSTIEMNQQIAITGQTNMVIPQTMTTDTQTVLIP